MSDSIQLGGSSKRFDSGWEKVCAIDKGIPQQFCREFQRVSPDFAKFLIEFPFGDVNFRPSLDSHSRELAIVSAITALGHVQPQLRLHLHAALNAFSTFGTVLREIEASLAGVQ